MIPADYIIPVWRGVPNGNGVGTVALDPREAAHVLEHGCTIDDERWNVRPWGDGTVQRDGRIVVRLERA